MPTGAKAKRVKKAGRVHVEVEFSLDDAKALMRRLQEIGNFDDFNDDREDDGLSEEVAFDIRDFVRDRIQVSAL